MAVQPKPKREYTYGDVFISLENCILPEEKLSETPSMKDGLHKEIETDLRILGCEFIQTAGILLKLPQVAMATGQILLQRFYYSKSLVKHDVEICAMACIFLAAKIEESPRRLRDIINVFHHIKQKRSKRPIVPMDFYSNVYFSLKNSVIKAERRVLKELGFCVHVKVPHKIIITYLQMLEHEKNTALTQRAWNYMNDGLRTNVFLKYAPEKIGCACIFLAARALKVVLPLRPPWWELFDADLEEVEEISLTILKLYARPKASMSKLDEEIEKAKKVLQEKKDAATKENGAAETSGSFTPAHVSPNVTSVAGSKPDSKTTSPAKISPANNNNEKKSKTEKESADTKKSSKKSKDDDARERKRRARSRTRSPTPPRRKNARPDTDSSYDSDPASPSPDRKRKTKKDSRVRNSHSSSDSEDDYRRQKGKVHRSQIGNRSKSKNQRENGHRTYNYDKRFQGRSRSRSRSRSHSRERKDKKYEKRRDKEKRRDDKHRIKVREGDRDYKNSYERFDKKGRR